MWFYALIQRLSNGQIVALRHRDETQAIRGLRRDMLEAWMFLENSLEQAPGEVLYSIYPSGVMLRSPAVDDVPQDILHQLSPSIIVELAA